MFLSTLTPALLRQLASQMIVNWVKRSFLSGLHARGYSKIEWKSRTDEKLLRSFRACLYKSLNPEDVMTNEKVSIVGAGAVGMACCIALLCKGITNSVALYDVNVDLCQAERWDMLDGSIFLNNCKLAPCSDVCSTKNSRVVVITAGVRPDANQDRLAVAQGTADIIKKIMPELVELSPKAVFIILSNPVDVMTWVARKIGNLPYERCISTGCHLDTARFRKYISNALKISPCSVNAYVLGEHGGSSVPVWSSVTVGGVRLKALVPHIGTADDEMNWSNIHKQVVDSAYRIISRKGYTNWSIGLTTADVISAIFEDSNRVLTVSTNVAGMYGIKDEIFLSLPCIIGKGGLSGVMRPYLNNSEKNALYKSAGLLLKAQCGIKF